jgi:hypothetical protein
MKRAQPSARYLWTAESYPAIPNHRGWANSIGKWDRDSLMVETAGFNGRRGLAITGFPHSDALRVIERFHRIDFGHMEVEITMDDPNARKAADALSAERQETLANEASNLNQAIARRTQQVFGIARKALTALATVSLEERLGEVFTRRLHQLDCKSKGSPREAPRTSTGLALVHSKFNPPCFPSGACPRRPECIDCLPEDAVG